MHTLLTATSAIQHLVAFTKFSVSETLIWKRLQYAPFSSTFAVDGAGIGLGNSSAPFIRVKEHLGSEYVNGVTRNVEDVVALPQLYSSCSLTWSLFCGRLIVDMYLSVRTKIFTRANTEPHDTDFLCMCPRSAVHSTFRSAPGAQTHIHK